MCYETYVFARALPKCVSFLHFIFIIRHTIVQRHQPERACICDKQNKARKYSYSRDYAQNREGGVALITSHAVSTWNTEYGCCIYRTADRPQRASLPILPSATLPSYLLWSRRNFSFLCDSRLTFFFMAMQGYANQWLNFRCSRSHAFRTLRTVTRYTHD